jgi:hypothetical protein
MKLGFSLEYLVGIEDTCIANGLDGSMLLYQNS